MDRQLFYNMLQNVGHYKHDLYQDIIFTARAGKTICPICSQGSLINIQIERDSKSRSKYYHKCQMCKNTWYQKTLKKA